MTISSWLNLGRPAPPGRGLWRDEFFLAPPYYSASAQSLRLSERFFIFLCVFLFNCLSVWLSINGIIQKWKSAQRDADTARALAVVRFGHRPPAATNTQTHRQDRLQYTARSVTTDQLCMKFYAMVGHNPGTNRWNCEWGWPKVKVARCQRSKSFFYWLTLFRVVVASRHKNKIKSSLLNSLKYFCMIIAVRLTVSKVGSHGESQWNTCS